MSCQSQIDYVRSAPIDELLEIVQNYNWSEHPEEVLGAIAERADCPLLVALEIFYSAEPESFEGEPGKPNSSPSAFLRRIHDRINAGGYLAYPEYLRGNSNIDTFRCIGDQDGNKERYTRYWQLDPRIVLPACERCPETEAQERAEAEKRGDAYVEKEAQMLATSILANPVARQSAEFILSISSPRIQARVAELLTVAKEQPLSIKKSLIARWLGRVKRP